MQELNLIDSSSSSFLPYYSTIGNTYTSRKVISRRRSSDSSSGSSDTLVDGDISLASIASSCATFISQGGDAYKCARSTIGKTKSDSANTLLEEVVLQIQSRLVWIFLLLVLLFECLLSL